MGLRKITPVERQTGDNRQGGGPGLNRGDAMDKVKNEIKELKRRYKKGEITGQQFEELTKPIIRELQNQIDDIREEGGLPRYFNTGKSEEAIDS